LPPGSVSQVCYVTFDVRAAAERWARVTGAGPFFMMALPSDLQKVYRGRPARDTFVAAIGFLGETCIELIQPTNDEPSIIREVLDTRGEGAVHHVYPKIRPLDAAAYDDLCAHYRASGLEEVLSFQLPGLGRNAFFDAIDSLGCFIEVLEVGADAYHAILGGVHDAHLGWDGSNPVRDMASLQQA
jgi:hypothetical protein